MRILLLIAILTMVGGNVFAQMILETLAGNKQLHYIHYVDKNIDSLGKWNFFNLNRFTVNYKNKSQNTVAIEGQLTYQLNSWLGVSAGGGFYGESFFPGVGLSLSYANKSQTSFIQLYPTLNMAEGEIAPSLLGVLGYTPLRNQKWGLSSQVIFGIDPLQAFQIIRLGVNTKQKFQFGIGLDLQQNFEENNVQCNIGPFIRFAF